MRTHRQRGSRVLYVAGSVGEFPDDVQDWLSRPENPAIASGNPYDALALLAKGLSPAALIVSMQAVDWNEMEFFDHLAQLCRETTVFVSGPAHQHAKMEAACHRGARFFEGRAASEALLADQYASGETSTAGIMAGSFRATAADPAMDRPSSSAPGSSSEDSHRSIAENDAGDIPKRETSPSEPSSPGVRLVADLESTDLDSTDEESAAQERIDHREGPGDAGQHEIPVPWLPSPQRPKRIPPGSPHAPGGTSHLQPETSEHRRRPSPVELTEEELAALLARPEPSSRRAAEERGS